MTDTSDPREVLGVLSNIDIFRSLPAEEVQALVSVVERLEYPVGAHVIREGEKGDALYFIEKGSVRVTRAGSSMMWHVRQGGVVGETALLTGEPRSATVIAETPLILWRTGKTDFDRIIAESPKLKAALEDLAAGRRSAAVPSRTFWVATAMRALEARSKGIKLWQVLMAAGFAVWVMLRLPFVSSIGESYLAGLQLLSGLLILQGSCEALVMGAERLGARLGWEGFISGTVGSLLSTLPEFVVIAFLVSVEPLAAFVTSTVTIFNNALAFSIYSFFLPKDREGAYAMPRSLTIAGGEILIAGGAVSLMVGTVMLVLRLTGERTVLAGWNLIAIGAVLIAIYGYYLLNLVRYYASGEDDVESHPADPGDLGHDTRTIGIARMFAVGIAGAYFGGEAIGGFAESALQRLNLPTVPTAAGLAFFAGISEYIIVYKSHRRGELGIALSNVFGGLTQVKFLLMPFGLCVIGFLYLTGGGEAYAVPINSSTLLLMLLLFPLFYALHQYLEQDKKLSNMAAAGMTGIYSLLLYFLFTAS
ncbi:MAG: cyclic nucleotide-binding domain-containing protein [Acidobacteria bacterium]|nr:cyclic nucleotide-binding domain-containing protein [Acidobacteriota bacterium]